MDGRFWKSLSDLSQRPFTFTYNILLSFPVCTCNVTLEVPKPPNFVSLHLELAQQCGSLRVDGTLVLGVLLQFRFRSQGGGAQGSGLRLRDDDDDDDDDGTLNPKP